MIFIAWKCGAFAFRVDEVDLDCFSSDTLISAPFWDREDRAPFWCSMPSRFMRKNSVQIGELVIKDFQWFAGIPVDCFMTKRYFFLTSFQLQPGNSVFLSHHSSSSLPNAVMVTAHQV